MSRRASPTPMFIVVTTIMLWLSTGIAAAAFWPVYQSSQLVIMVAVTTIVASGIAIAGSVFRLPAHVVVFAALLAYVVLGVPLAVPGQALYGLLPTLDGLRDLGLGTALGWKQLLTIALPVASYQALLVPAFIVVLVTVVSAMSIALRARFRELAVLGPVVLFVAAILLGATTEFYSRALPLALTASVLFWLIFIRWFRRHVGARRLALDNAGNGWDQHADDSAFTGGRTLVGAGLIIAIAAGGSVGAAALLPPTLDREVPRSSIVQPFNPRSYASPLSTFRAYHQNESATMLTIDGLPEGSRVRLATLDTFNGIVYSVGGDEVSADSGSFTLVPYQFDQSAVAGEQVEVDVTVGQYAGVWLPTVGQLESIEFSGQDAERLRSSFYYNDGTGSAAVVRELREGDRYRLTAVLPSAPTERQLLSLRPGTANLPPVGVLPDELAGALDGYVGDVVGDGARLAAALDGLRENGYISHGVSPDEPVSRSGHSADRITELFTAPQMIGDGEQYAVAGALMARELGFPARVVMGFLPREQKAGPVTISGADVSAWIEVDTAQFGWVALDPTPLPRDIPEQLPEEPTQVARPQSPVQPPVDDQDIPDEQLPPSVEQEDVPAVDPFLVVVLAVLRIGGWVLLAAAILVSPFLAIVVAKFRRRRERRKAGTPLGRISGGWNEFEDAVLDHGFTPPAAATRSEFASTVGGVQPLVLAAAADRASFAPSGPLSIDADQVWRSVDELRRSLDRGLSRWQRLKARVSLRSLRRSGRRSSRAAPFRTDPTLTE